MWYPETDNIKSLKKIHNFVFMPIIGHEGQSNGLIQMFNFKNQITRLQVRKYLALAKYLGSCLEKVTMESMMIETVVALDLMMGGLYSVNSQLEDQNKINSHDMMNLQNQMKTVKNPVDVEYAAYQKIGCYNQPYVEETK